MVCSLVEILITTVIRSVLFGDSVISCTSPHLGSGEAEWARYRGGHHGWREYSDAGRKAALMTEGGRH